MTNPRYIAVILLLCFIFVSCGENGTDSEVYGGTASDELSEVIEESSENADAYSPSSGELEKEKKVTCFVPKDSEVVTLEGHRFTFGTGSNKGLSFTGKSRYKDGKAIMEDGTYMFYRPEAPMKAERLVIRFKVSFSAISAQRQADTNFRSADEIMTLAFTEKNSSYTSSSQNAVRLRAKTQNNKIVFTGYDKDNQNKDYIGEFDAKSIFDVKVVFDGSIAEITVNDKSVRFLCPYDTFTDFTLRVRKGDKLVIEEMDYYGTQRLDYEIPETLKQMLDEGCFKNCFSSSVTADGVLFSRMTNKQFIDYGNLHFSVNSGITLDFYTDSKNVELTYKTLYGFWDGWQGGFDVYLNGEFSRRFNRGISIGGITQIKYTVPDENEGKNRITFYFPCCMNVSVLNVRLNRDAVFAPVEKHKTVLFLGDSITEGLNVSESSSIYISGIARYFNLDYINQAASGTVFDKKTVDGDYGDFNPECVFIGYGTNNYGDGTAEYINVKLYIKTGMELILNAIKERWNDVKIIGLLPIARENESAGKYTLTEVSEYIASLYMQYGIDYIDCHSFVPAEQQYFTDSPMLHPNAKGHELYAEKLSQALNEYFTHDSTDWKKKAEEELQ